MQSRMRRRENLSRFGVTRGTWQRRSGWGGWSVIWTGSVICLGTFIRLDLSSSFVPELEADYVRLEHLTARLWWRDRIRLNYSSSGTPLPRRRPRRRRTLIPVRPCPATLWPCRVTDPILYRARPNEAVFPSTQLYAVLLLPYGGKDLESYTFSKSRPWAEAAGIFWSVAQSLAAAEEQLHFEVRPPPLYLNPHPSPGLTLFPVACRISAPRSSPRPDPRPTVLYVHYPLPLGALRRRRRRRDDHHRLWALAG